MKRSQVLKLIEGLYRLEIDRVPKENPPCIFAENLLCHLEEDVGMRPPYDAHQDDGVDTFEWEKE